MLATHNMQWTNINSLITVSLDQAPSVYEPHSTQYCTAEPEDSIWKWGCFLYLASWLVYWVGVPVLLLEQWLILL